MSITKHHAFLTFGESGFQVFILSQLFFSTYIGNIQLSILAFTVKMSVFSIDILIRYEKLLTIHLYIDERAISGY